MNIYCIKNKGYQWRISKNIYFKGYIQLENGEIMRDETAINFFSTINNFNHFIEALKSLYGVYAIIIQKNTSIWAAVDISRSIPIYYSQDLTIISDSSEKIRQILGIQQNDVNLLRTLDMYATTNILHENTIYDEIKQIELGKAIEINKDTLNIVSYFQHNNEIVKISKKKAKNLLHTITNNAINRMLKATSGRPLVLSLSGGYDSRYIACALKDVGVENVICYSYGNKNSYELKEAKIIADALGYKWIAINYTDNDVHQILSSTNFPFFKYCIEHDYIIYLQNYIAIQKMTYKNLIPKDSVFITGLCNDMPTGNYIPEVDIVKSYGMDVNGLSKYIIDVRYVRYHIKNKIKNKLVNEIKRKIISEKYKIYDYQSFISTLDCLTTGYDHSRSYLHMNNIHEFFGFEWLIPCWDKELLKFWYSIPAEMRIHQKLYEEYLLKDIASKYGLGTKKYLNFHSQSKLLTQLRKFFGGYFAKTFYLLGLPIRRRTDLNNFAPLEVDLYKHIKQKKSINFQHASILHMLTIYVMEQRYGIAWYEKIKEFIK